MRHARITCCLLLLVGLGPGCDADGVGADGELDPEYGKPLMSAPPTAAKSDTTGGIIGPNDVFEGGDTEVWSAPNRWDDRDTPAARLAGMAWEADSGLDWDEKYALWIESMEKTEAGFIMDTFTLTTPWGVTLPAPSLECAEVAVFLRVAFASWHGLPFYLTAWANGEPVHFGHFGVVSQTEAYPNFPYYSTRYDDYSDRGLEEALADWPSDPSLARRFLTQQRDDENTFLGPEAYSGAYFDQIFLNKRVGHFLMTVLTFTGSVHLAASDNTFNLTVEALREGDTLLKRWQRQGVGHTMVVMRVNPLDGGRAEAELASGSMPRRQPFWESPSTSKYRFTHIESGGPGTNGNGEEYATLGGGLKRWRIATVIDGRWRNVVKDSDREHYIPSFDLEAIAERTALFEAFLTELTPEEKMATLVEIVEAKRAHLREYPASCSARAGREEAFAAMYELAPEMDAPEASGPVNNGMTPQMVDLEYRVLEDYVFAPLEYDQSRTCCWNSSTPEMYEIIMAHAESYIHDDLAAECRPPLVFKMRDGGYSDFEAYAVEIGLGDEWVAWRADESCPQESTVTTDTETPAPWHTDFCELTAW
ncbi:MAG: hypothetical protein QF464_03485 [Myxococcota bacterium]|nr:hypothetical protein [Myxococcota bacterium]